MDQSLHRVLIQAPASTSNCGPGFDTLSIGLQLYNFIELTRRDDQAVRCQFSPAPAETGEMVREAAECFFDSAGIPTHGFDYDIWGEIPTARGLGSSSTIRAGILAGLNELAGAPLDRQCLLRLTSRIDHAPDNASAGILGGFCVSRLDPRDRSYVRTIRFPLPDTVSFVAVSPADEIHTPLARAALPREVSFEDAAATVNSACSFVAALASGRYEDLAGTVTDFLQQPYRERYCPFTHEAIAAGVSAGAWCGWLSGSGSTVICLGPAERALEIGQKMTGVFSAAGADHRFFHMRADNEGLTVVRRETGGELAESSTATAAGPCST